MAPTKQAGKSEKNKALAARKAALKGTNSTATRKVRTSATFRRPNTYRAARNPVYQRKSIPGTSQLDQYSIIRQPLTTESAMKKIEDQNTLVFLCDVRANKHQIRDSIKKLYGVQALKINTLIRPDGIKKAYVRLTGDIDALEVANKIGVI
ncbi:ribosomal protein L23/L15e core domain-containing protein [Syncephalis plumigaleata]|nr:ribosomal protein L23/L15e core domain-containing protein [Syncephalis plumigaleata]